MSLDMMSVIKKPSNLETKLVFLSLDVLQPSKNNKSFKVSEVLKKSIEMNGLQTALSVIDLGNGFYEISQGHNRREALYALVKENPNFKYKWVGADDLLYSPIRDGVPCIICRNNHNDIKQRLNIINANKSRVLSKLEQYDIVMDLKEIYDELKCAGEIKYGEGREREWISEQCDVSPDVVAKIISGKWLIKPNNINEIRTIGSYELWDEMNKTKQKKNPANKPISQYSKDLSKFYAIKNSFVKNVNKYNSDEKRRIIDELEKALNEVKDSFNK